MPEENKEQEAEQAQEPVQEAEQKPVQEGADPAQEGTDPAQESTEEPQDNPAKEKSGDGLLLPVLYALLAAAGAFTLIMIIGIVLTIVLRPSKSPPAESTSQGTTPTRAQTQFFRSPDSEGVQNELPFSFL